MTLAQFASLFYVADVKFLLQNFFDSADGTEIIYNENADPKWIADVTTSDLPKALAEGVKARLNSTGLGARLVELTNVALPYPAGDPKGLVWAADASSPKIASIQDRSHVTFSGFPPGYSVVFGEFFDVVDAAGSRFLGQFTESFTVGGGGSTGSVEISPFLVDIFDVNDVVSMAKPRGLFTYVPNSLRVSWSSGRHQQLTFKMRQTYLHG
jgi:hypothetical protein